MFGLLITKKGVILKWGDTEKLVGQKALKQSTENTFHLELEVVVLSTNSITLQSAAEQKRGDIVGKENKDE